MANSSSGWPPSLEEKVAAVALAALAAVARRARFLVGAMSHVFSTDRLGSTLLLLIYLRNKWCLTGWLAG